MRPLRIFALALVCIAGTFVISCGSPAEENSDIPITTASDEARTAFIEGRDAWDVGRMDEARALFDKAIAADASFAMAYLMRARTATSAPDWKKHADLAIANRAGASPGEQIMVDMFSAMMEDNADRELELAKQLVKDFPKSARAQHTLSTVYSGLDDVAATRAALEAAVALDPSWSLPHRALAISWVFDEPRDLAKAEDYAKKYVEMKPEEADAHIMLGDVYRARVDLVKAGQSYAKAAEVDPTNSVALSKKGHVETFLGNYDQARATFDMASDKSKTWKIGSKNFGVYTWLYAGDLSTALAANQAVIDQIPTLVPDADQQNQALASCYADRYRIACEAGDFDLAAEAFTRYAEFERSTVEELQNPAFTKATEGRLAVQEGMLKLWKGDFASAVRLADEAESKVQGLSNPGALKGIQILRGLIALREGNADAALKHFQAAGSDRIEVKYYEALAQEELGETDKARALFTDVANWNFNGLEYALIRSKAIAKLQS